MMKTPRFAPLTLPALVATVAVLLTAQTAQAVDYEKANNGTALNLAGSYTGGVVPGASDRILVTSVMVGTSGTQSAALGGALSIDGIVFDATANKTLIITGTNTLTLGASGISMNSASTGSLSFNGPSIMLGADQTWDLAARGLTITGATTLDSNGKALAITTTGGQIFFKNTTALSLNATISGSAALTLDSTGTELTLTNANSSFTNGIAISAGNTVTASSMSVTAGGGGISAVGSGAVQLKGGTFKYSGNTATSAQNVLIDSRFVGTVEVTTAGQTLTLSNFKNTNSANASLLANGANLGGAGHLTITNIVADSTQAQRTAFTVNKFGTGTLTLTAINTYTGATTIEAGTLALGASGSIASSAITVAAGATFDTSARASYAFNTTKTTTIGVGATSAGQIKAAAATFSSAALALDFGATSTLLSSYTLLVRSGLETGDFASVTATGTSIAGSFTNGGSGNWTLTAGGYNLTFNESLGTLTAVSAVPEPSTYALIGGILALAGASLRRRRVKHGA
ncbi:beta strand repeat-containing protein [Rariglobus hedericola]|uniref:PEP-CTERM sorting domain-containing protein n=1 Tax=Rariglobus hedericola TaxID=2597822 RepID=A0A556QLM4_9BACT|nr:autotransporter-associated beta strand repeat-containing protein [Rariglobus hedericola]TSJ77538.1 PEP-CTERM sorting domain-containing protein [Rariglobus hedericola]